MKPMNREVDKRILRHFGLERMGWFESTACKNFVEDIMDAFLHNKMLALSGPVGTMKTSLFERASINQGAICRFIYVTNLNKEKITIASIMNALIYGLSDENPRRDLEARTIQLKRILGETVVNDKRTVVLVIEEAHRLPPSIFRAIKELREMTYKGSSNLFSVVLIGHPNLVTNIESRKEAYWRCTIVEMNEASGWMTFKERRTYIQQVFGKAIADQAADTIATICKVPLQIVDYVEKKMIEARKMGKKIVDSDVVRPTVRELKDAYGLSVRAIAEETKLSLASVQGTMDNPDSKFTPQVMSAINAMAAKSRMKKVS